MSAYKDEYAAYYQLILQTSAICMSAIVFIGLKSLSFKTNINILIGI